jgi:hypothetical protein
MIEAVVGAVTDLSTSAARTGDARLGLHPARIDCRP